MKSPRRICIDLISDTATRPTPAMRQAMANAEMGDEQLGEDPSVNALNERVADLLGQDAAMFLPSGTMCNQVAIVTHARQAMRSLLQMALDAQSALLDRYGGEKSILANQGELSATPIENTA